MDKETNSQLELFSSAGNVPEITANPRRPFLSFICGYEKTILLIIGFIIIGITAFILGIERGKNLTARKADLQFSEVAANTQTQKIKVDPKQNLKEVLPVKTALPQVTAATTAAPKQLSQENVQKYTVQIASFKTSVLAQKEAQALKNIGYTPIIATKGKYTVILVGSFMDKEAANSLLTQLKKRYKDCFIRRL